MRSGGYFTFAEARFCGSGCSELNEQECETAMKALTPYTKISYENSQGSTRGCFLLKGKSVFFNRNDAAKGECSSTSQCLCSCPHSDDNAQTCTDATSEQHCAYIGKEWGHLSTDQYCKWSSIRKRVGRRWKTSHGTSLNYSLRMARGFVLLNLNSCRLPRAFVKNRMPLGPSTP